MFMKYSSQKPARPCAISTTGLLVSDDPWTGKNTLSLPKTEFPCAPIWPREPLWLKRWADERHYEKLLAAREAAGRASLRAARWPPYATGGIHYGTLLNKVLQRHHRPFAAADGKRACFVPGWDCHGLPIEHQVEKAAGGRFKLDTAEFRKRCEVHALKFVDVIPRRFPAPGIAWACGTIPYLEAGQGLRGDHRAHPGGFAARGLHSTAPSGLCTVAPPTKRRWPRLRWSTL